MIQIIKNNPEPSILSSKGLTQKNNDISEYERDNSRFINIARKTPKKSFKSKIYGCKEVKDQLKIDQHEKCCYCENTFLDVSHGDVEHFRPKKGYTLIEKGGINKPGYYWMAYDWKNLHLACEICNRTHKKNYFPLKNETNRILDHHREAKIGNEKPLLLCPTDDNSKHFTFTEHLIKSETEEGKTSIKHYGLDRIKLEQSRMEWFETLDVLDFFYNINPETINDTEIENLNNISRKSYSREKIKKLHLKSKEILDKAATSKGKFSLMVRNNFPDLPIN